MYHLCPSLRKPENNILLLLTWSSRIHGLSLRILSEWASSTDTLSLYQRLMEDFRNPQEPEQLALILAALLCHGRLLPYTSSETIQPISGCYLADLDVLLNDRSLSNQRAVFERTGFSFLRVLTTLKGESEDMIQLLAVAIDTETPLLELFDGFTDQYAARRIRNRLSHRSAFQGLGGLCLVETMLKFSMDGDSSPQSINSISEGYFMVEFLGESCEDARRILMG